MTSQTGGGSTVRPGSDPPPELSDSDFDLPDGGWPDDKRAAALALLRTYLTYYHERFLGYQVNQCLDGDSASADAPSRAAADAAVEHERNLLAPFLTLHTNNVGDPYHDSNLATHTKWLERNVLAYYARLWNIEPYDAADRKSGWGYILSMGSSEGNVYGLLNARNYLAGWRLLHPGIDPPRMGSDGHGDPQSLVMTQAPAPRDDPKKFTPVIFFSEDTHYSVAKAAHTLAIPTFGAYGQEHYPRENPSSPGTPWPVEVPSHEDGTIKIDALAEFVAFFAKKGHPILVVLNLGSTFKGAHDNADAVAAKLRPIFADNGLDRRQIDNVGQDFRTGYWIHIDGALGSTYLPFLRRAQADKLPGIDLEPTVPKADFSIPEVSSIVTSGHKYPGAPWPCGVYMTRTGLQLKPPALPDVIGAPDTTFGGSRNAFSAIVLWNFLAKHSYDKQVEMIAECERLAGYAYDRLGEVDAQLRERGWDELYLARSSNALSIRFRKPDPRFVRPYSLAHVPIADKDRSGWAMDLSHLYVMPHVKQGLIDALVEALLRDPEAFPKRAWYELPPRPDGGQLLGQMAADTDAVLYLAMNRGFA